MFFNILATFAEFEVDLLRMRTREGMAIARANGKLPGKSPKLNARQRVHVLKLYEAGEHTRSPISPSCSPSAAPPSTAKFYGHVTIASDHAPPTVSAVAGT